MATSPKDETQGTATAAAATPAAQPVPAAPTIRYIDVLDCKESFADSINNVYFDGQSLRIEFGITRLDDIKPNAPVTGRRFPAQRLVLTPVAAVELINRMQQVAAALAQAGVLKQTPTPTPTRPPDAVAKE
jgi:hypothetical protein